MSYNTGYKAMLHPKYETGDYSQDGGPNTYLRDGNEIVDQVALDNIASQIVGVYPGVTEISGHQYDLVKTTQGDAYYMGVKQVRHHFPAPPATVGAGLGAQGGERESFNPAEYVYTEHEYPETPQQAFVSSPPVRDASLAGYSDKVELSYIAFQLNDLALRLNRLLNG